MAMAWHKYGDERSVQAMCSLRHRRAGDESEEPARVEHVASLRGGPRRGLEAGDEEVGVGGVCFN